MDLARSVYSRDLKVSVMRAMDAGESGGRVAGPPLRFWQRWGLTPPASGFLILPRHGLTRATQRKAVIADLVAPTFTKNVKVGQPPNRVAAT